MCSRSQNVVRYKPKVANVVARVAHVVANANITIIIYIPLFLEKTSILFAGVCCRCWFRYNNTVKFSFNNKRKCYLADFLPLLVEPGGEVLTGRGAD